MRRRVSSIFVGLSLLIFLATGWFWLRIVFRDYLVYDVPRRWLNPTDIVGSYSQANIQFPRFSLAAIRAYEFRTHHPRPNMYGPTYPSREYDQWERQFRRHESYVARLGFQYVYGHTIWVGSFPQGTKAAHFVGYETHVVVPFWFVLVSSGIAPALWLRRRLRVRRRRRRGLCIACGYDMRATPEGCPECGMGRKAAAIAIPQTSGSAERHL